MNYVKSLKMFGTDAKEIPCIRGEGNPTITTEGAVGCLYMDTLTGDMYKCVSVDGGRYVWSGVADQTSVAEAKTHTVAESKAYANKTFANSPKGEASGEVVILENVSPVEHELFVKLSVPDGVETPNWEDVKVTKSSKNLFCLKGRKQVNFGASGNSTVRSLDENAFYFLVSATNAYSHYDFNSLLNHTSMPTSMSDNSLSFFHSTWGNGVGVPFKTRPNQTYTVNCDFQDPKTHKVRISFYDENGNWLGVKDTNTFTTPEKCAWLMLCFICATSTWGEFKFSNIQLEYGSEATPFVEYVEPETVNANADGTVNLTSISPNMAITTDTDNVQINAEYSKDIKTLTKEVEEGFEDFKVYNNISNPFMKDIAHRGYCAEAPENTLSAVKLAKQKGFEYVEIDVSFTSDNIPVLLHDDTINRTARNTDGTELSTNASISSITYAVASGYDYGVWFDKKYQGEKIPKFEDFIKLCKKIGLKPYVELKSTITDAQTEIVVNLVKRYGMLKDVTWISFSSANLEKVLNLIPNARVGFAVFQVTQENVDWVNANKTENNDIFIDAHGGIAGSGYPFIESAHIELCATNNIPIEAYTSYEGNAEPERPIEIQDAYVSGYTSNKYLASHIWYNKEM